MDVEERVARRDLDALMAAVLTPDERAEVEAAGGGERIGRFYGLWTIKEALVKALGTGLQLDMAGFEVPAAMRRGVTTGDFRFPHLPATNWRVENLGNEHFAAAVAHEWIPRPAPGGRCDGIGQALSRCDQGRSAGSTGGGAGRPMTAGVPAAGPGGRGGPLATAPSFATADGERRTAGAPGHRPTSARFGG